MIRLASVALVAAAVFMISPLQGQQKVGLGDSCPAFNLPGTDGKNHALADYKKDVLVVIITCNHCPVAVAYEDRIIKFTKDFSAKADVVAINVNNGEADKLPKMKERAAEKGFNFSYLYDESQAIAKSLSATVTPHFYVFNKERKLVYVGAMDDTNNASAVKTNYLADAVTAASEGKTPTVATTKARGCGVQYGSK
jgi:peroxiredoxin